MKETDKEINLSKSTTSEILWPDMIKTFLCDTDADEEGKINGYSGGGCMLTIHSIKRQLFSIQYTQGFLIGIGNPFLNKEYREFLNELPFDIIIRLEIKVQWYKFSADNALLFSVKNAFRLIPDKKDGNAPLTYLLYYPDNSMELLTPPEAVGYSSHKRDAQIGKRISGGCAASSRLFQNRK